MSTEFIAGFVSGIAGLIVGSPFDIVKTIQQTGPEAGFRPSWRTPSSWFTGLLAPILGLGFMNAILFWSYNLIMSHTASHKHALYEWARVFGAGFFSGLCVCFVSVPTELVKVKAQTSGMGSMQVFRCCLQNLGVAGLFSGFLITIARDSIGYGFYFLAYEVFLDSAHRYVKAGSTVLFSGGMAGLISWLSIFPLDTIKTRIQADSQHGVRHIRQPLFTEDMENGEQKHALGMWHCTRMIYRERGIAGFFDGLPIVMLRAFIVNAVIFWVDALVQQYVKRT